jgi:hypothetical protein
MARLSRHGGSHVHSNIGWEGQVLRLADDGDNDIDDMPSMGKLQCPNCGYRSDNADFQVSGGTADTSDPASPSDLQTPARGDYAARSGFRPRQVTVTTGPGGAGLSNETQRTPGGVVLMANGRPRIPVRDPGDLIVTRGQGGTAVIRHRMGGEYIGELGRGDDGAWRSLIDGTELSPHTHQRGALQELVGTWNRSALDPARPPAMALQGPPPQPDLLSQLGVTNVRSFAGSTDDGDDSSSGGGSSDGNGLNPRGQAIYKKLIARKLSPAQAMAMARRAQNTKPGSFGGGGS